MLNHNALFRQQLRRIATTVNKKHSVLRKEVIKTCEVFQNEQLPVFPYEVCFGLFRQVADTNSVSAGVLFLPFMQNVINLGFAHEQMTQQILNLLGQIKSLPKFQGLDLESKMQQTVLLLVSKHAITLFNLSCTHAIFNILMALDNPHSKMLWNKTLSIAVQISLLHLNQVADDPSPKKTELFKSYLSDMVQLARGEQVGWLTEPAEQFIFMALLGDLLDEKYLKLQKSQFREILTVLLSPLRRLTLKLYEATIFQIPTSPTKKWQVPVHNKLIICLRLACKIAVVYDCGFQLLEQIVKMVGQKAGAKGLGYECINYLFASPAWMHTMLQSSSGDLFNFVMTTLFNAVKHIQPDLKQGIDLIRSDLQRPPKLFSSNVLEVHFGELCPLGEVRALVRSIDEIVLTFFSIYSEVYHIELDRRLEGKAPLEKTFKFIQKTVFEIVKAVIGKEMTEQTLQSLLKTCQRIINLGGVVGDSSTALYIKLLCRHCLPGGLNNISLRHVQINKMILSTANCLGNLFSTACWVTLWKAFENYALYYNRYLRAQPNQRNSDVQILYASMDSIFVQSAAYDQAYLQTMLQSLVEATYECLENTYVEETKKIFAFERIQQVFRLNLHRLAKVWPPLVSSLLILTTSKVQQFRLASLALINTLVPVALHYLHTHPDAITEPFTSLNYETLLLQPWKHLAESPFNEVKAELALAVDKLVIDYGHIMGAGWGGLLSVVRSLADMTALQAIVQTYLDKIQPHMDFIVDCIDKVERSLSDTNQKYLCLTLIWAVGDHAYRRQMTPLLHKIFALLLKPEQTFCLGTQARHSSFYILAQLLVHNCDEKGEQFWNWVFKLVHSFVTFVVGKCSESREGIEEVIKNLLTNLLKIYRKCLIAVEGNSAFLVEQLGGFFDLATKLLQFRLSQIYHCTLRQSRELLAAAGTLATATKEFWSFLQKLTEVYFLQNDNKMLKLLITYLPVEIYDVLGYALGEIESRLSLVYKLVEKVFLLRLEAEEKDIKIAQMRIFFEEKSFNQFFKKLYVTVVDSNSSEIICSYHEKLIKTLHKLLLYEDQPFLVKLLPFLGSIADKHPQKLQYDAPIQLLRSLLLLKWSQTWRKKHAKTKDPPVWLVATHESVRLGHTLASNLHQPNCQLPYAKLLAIEVQLLGRPPCASHEGGDPDFLMNFYDSQSTLLYFVVDNYFLNEKGTNIVTPQHQQQVMGILGEALASFKEGDRTSRAKNAYDVLFKAVKSRGQVCREVQDRQRELAGLLLRRVVTVLKSYSALQSQKRGSASDLEKETCFLLKQMLHLQTGQGTFEQQRPYLNTQMEVVAKQGSAIWKSRCGMILAAYPLLIELSGCGTAEVRELVKECLAIGVKSLFTQLSI